MEKKFKDKVVVVTGASSGIGRATALELARQGAGLVLAARRENLLEEVAAECRKAGSKVLVVPTDVSSAGAVARLARRSIAEFGRFDAWVNNAGVMVVGRFQDVPVEEERRLMEVNVFGCFHGSKEAIRHFLEHGNGTLINVSSVDGKLSQPYAAAYSASKHAVRGLGMSLRQELSVEEHKNIHVCTVLPAVIDTPLFQHSGNHTGHPLKAMPPIYPATDVAQAIVGLIASPQDEVIVGRAGKAMNAGLMIAPWQTQKAMAKTVKSQEMKYGERSAPTPGNLFEPLNADREGVSGGWRKTGSGLGLWSSLTIGAAAVAGVWALSQRGVQDGAASGHRDPRPEESNRGQGSGREAAKERGLDKTIADSFPTSDPPSSIPDPSFAQEGARTGAKGSRSTAKKEKAS